MKKLLLVICLLLGACTSNKQAPPLPVQEFSPDAILLRYQADPMLNSFDNLPHTMVLVIYQLSAPDGFKSLISTSDGLRELLALRRFDSSVVDMHRIIVQPGEVHSETLNKGKDTTWVGVVAGYYHLKPKNCAQLFQIPVINEESGFIFKTKSAYYGKLDMNLQLTPYGMLKGGKPK